MKKHLHLFLTLISLSLLVSCQGQKNPDNPTPDLKPIGWELPGLTKPIGKADTIFAENAPSRITRKIRRNKNGSLLMAAFENVILYDGKSFSKLPPVEGVESIDAFDALQDSKGNIWIASTHHGLFLYDGQYFKQFTTDNGLVNNRTIDLHEDKTGNIWIATMDGVSCYNGTSFRNFTTEEGLTHNDVSTILEDKTGKIWFGTRGAACVYDPVSSVFREVTNEGVKSFKNVWSIIEDQKGNIWLAGEDGLWFNNGGTFTNVSTEFVNCVFEDQKGNIWTTSPKGILSCYEAQSLFNQKVSPIEIYRGDSMFFRVMEDDNGNIWVGTLKGILRYDGKSVECFMRENL